MHEPVMVKEVAGAFGLTNAHLNRQVRIIDATVGHAGHSVEFVKAHAKVLGIDMDKTMLAKAHERLTYACPTPMGECFILVQGNFRDIKEIANTNNFSLVDGVLFDLGVSNIHLKSPLRGFSFSNPEADLDMRLYPDSQGVTAKDLLNVLDVTQLTRMFRVTMDFPHVKKLAKEVVNSRNIKPFQKVGDFLEVIQINAGKKTKLNPATKAFLAVRIAVNSELDNLSSALPDAFAILRPGGRLVIISFHSGEDRLVKKYFRETEMMGLGKVITKKPLIPNEEEIKRNPRARSAKLRIIEKQ